MPVNPLTVQITLNLLTILGSGVVTAIVAYKLNANRAERDFLRKKLEDCYDAVHHFCIVLGKGHLPVIEALRHTWTWNEANAMIMEHSQESDRNHWPTAEKLVNIYFPTLQESLLKITRARDRLCECEEIAKRQYAEGGTFNATINIYKSILLELDSAEKEFKQDIFKLSRKLK
jgi:hypothetical protein